MLFRSLKIKKKYLFFFIIFLFMLFYFEINSIRIVEYIEYNIYKKNNNRLNKYLNYLRCDNINRLNYFYKTELLRISTYALELAYENNRLKRLMKLDIFKYNFFILTDLLYETLGLLNKRIIFNKGIKDGVKPGMLIISKYGIIGQILYVTPKTSEAILINDKKFLLPVKNIRNGLRMIAFGSKLNFDMEIKYLPANSDIKKGDIIVTNGVEDLFPSGIPIAKVCFVKNDLLSGFTNVNIKPFSDINICKTFAIIKIK